MVNLYLIPQLAFRIDHSKATVKVATMIQGYQKKTGMDWGSGCDWVVWGGGVVNGGR